MATKLFCPHEAITILQKCKIPTDADFYDLEPRQIDRLLDEASRRNYRKPNNADGPRGQYWHDYLQRAASRLEDD